ncbi:MAG: cytochrome c oxidase accessory protein CcoG [Boseongicola sp.]|nr:MAG: cytochrome c oxidase accessory protein CcoG [Boseongicola sp.]
MNVTESLYAAREPIFPKRVYGKFRNLKWAIMAVTLGIYYLTPWIRWDRGPNLPDQAVLVDLANRRFYFFWIEIWPHEFYFVAGMLIMAGLGLFLFTSALGRVWCGYTCPQTVWTDLFILVERWIEGDRNARIRLHRANWSFRKVRLRITKWIVWALIGLATGGAWVFYFADAPTLAMQFFSLNAPSVAWATVAILTATTFIFGGFMREQVCIYMCPWPRIQGAMMDNDTLTVGYRDWRGEPRGKKRDSTAGDCIDCNACVAVCPKGIDIREGQQMECITCALCIDACDEIMEKVGRERGLIDYLALSDAPKEQAGEKPRPNWQHVLRPRIILYTAIWSIIGLAMLYALFIRPDIEMTVAPVRNPTYVTMADGSVRNTYELRLRNKHGTARLFGVHIRTHGALVLNLEGHDINAIEVPANETLRLRVYVTAPSDSEASRINESAIRLWVDDIVSGERAFKNTVFNGTGASS